MSTSASRGAIVMVAGRGLFFVFGYLVVVLLAREMGPVAYGAYGVIMSVLVWLEQSARHTVPAATAKLVAETDNHAGAIGSAALALNFILHAVMFVALWLIAPWLEMWFAIENGTYLFRLAAVDLPLFGTYAALQGIYQGQHRFHRIVVAELGYAFVKLVGTIIIVRMGISIEKALIVNIAASAGGIALLFTWSVLTRREQWHVHTRAIAAIAAPVAVYSVATMLASSLDIWVLGVGTSAAASATLGIYIAALNVARVPSLALSALAQVLLPSVARAAAANDDALVRHYVNQALRFCLILYLPICLVLFASPEELMDLIYSSTFSGGAGTLVVLVIAQGLWTIQSIFAAVLIAADKARVLGVLTVLTIVFAWPIMVWLVDVASGIGAAIATGLVALANITTYSWQLRRRFGAVVRLRNLGRIAAAGVIMFAVSIVCARFGNLGVIVSCAAGLIAYSGALIVLSAVKAEELAVFVSSDRRVG